MKTTTKNLPENLIALANVIIRMDNIKSLTAFETEMYIGLWDEVDKSGYQVDIRKYVNSKTV